MRSCGTGGLLGGVVVLGAEGVGCGSVRRLLAEGVTLLLLGWLAKGALLLGLLCVVVVVVESARLWWRGEGVVVGLCGLAERWLSERRLCGLRWLAKGGLCGLAEGIGLWCLVVSAKWIRLGLILGGRAERAHRLGGGAEGRRLAESGRGLLCGLSKGTWLVG